MKVNKIRKNIFLYPILYLLSIFYRFITNIRNLFYDKHIFKSTTFDVPVISIGNITVGGTGKTPFTLFLINQLIEDYPKIAVVSRGYGRESKGVVVVSDGKGSIVSAEKGGDEPVLIARKFNSVVVIASEDRKKGIQLAIDQFNADLILLDDAFQHRKVNRQCDIVLINANHLLLNEKILPLGNLREDLNHLKRAGIVIFTKVENEINKVELEEVINKFKGPIFKSKFNTTIVYNRSLRLVSEIKKMYGSPVIAFAGIADPKSFKESLQKRGIKIVDFISFKDHQKYNKEQIEKIENAARLANCRILLTTEKDIVKLAADDLIAYDLFAVGLEIEVFKEEKLLKKIKQCIDSKQ